MTEKQIFESDNEYSSFQTEVGDDTRAVREGWCAAASALWCKNRTQGKTGIDTKPSELRAGLLQVKYRWDGEHLTLLENVGLTGKRVYNDMDCDTSLRSMANSPGLYFFSTYFYDGGGHSMAIDSRPGALYWYDIEEGLFQYDTAMNLRKGVKSRYKGSRDVWDGIRIVI